MSTNHKKQFIIKKIVLARNLLEAIRIEKKFEVESVSLLIKEEGQQEQEIGFKKTNVN